MDVPSSHEARQLRERRCEPLEDRLDLVPSPRPSTPNRVALEKENRELRRANEILKAAAHFWLFAVKLGWG